MKIKQEIEWVVGENPGEPSVKLVVVEHEGRVEVTTGSFSRCDSTSGPRWYYTNNAEIPYWTSSVLAWASMPHYHGFPADGQKVEFGDVYQCDNSLADPARLRRLIKAVEFIAKRLSLQIGREFTGANVHELQQLNQTINRLDTIRDYILNGKEPEA